MITTTYLPIRTVVEYYDAYSDEKSWKKVHSAGYLVKMGEHATEPTDTTRTIYVNKYGDVMISEGMCVMRYVISDIRGWVIEWLDEDSMASVMIQDWVDSKEVARRFKLSQMVVHTRKDYEEEREWMRKELEREMSKTTTEKTK